MTGNDKQIDVLIRRHAQHASRITGGEHLDADELGAFAEGQLPPAARSRYVAHLADCDQCRQTVSHLAISGGATIRAEPVVERTPLSWSQRMLGLFALPGLRYAAFAAVVLIVAAVGFIALRQTRQRTSDLVAVNEPQNQQPRSAINPSADARNDNSAATLKSQTEQPKPSRGDADAKRFDEPKSLDTAPALKDSSRNVPPPAPTPADAAKKEAAPTLVAVVPSYAPVPPSETQSTTVSRPASGMGGVGTFSGPRKGDSNEKLATAERERDAAKEPAQSEEANRAGSDKLSQARRQPDQKQKGPSRNFELNQQANQSQVQSAGRAEAPKKTAGDDRSSSDEAATRSAGGRNFQKQGTAWVDQKYKQSMGLRTVARGTEEFKKLDSGLRAIADQLGGQVIVVWKGKAYFIR